MSSLLLLTLLPYVALGQSGSGEGRSGGREPLPLLKSLRCFESVNADLHFREDGIHTVITFGYVK